MPLEIRELVIRTIVSSDSAVRREETGESGSLSEAEQAAIIAACTAQVLSILQSRSER
jgi:hypothetical protein